MRMFDPLGLMDPMIEASHILIESQTVIGLRLAGMAGFWPMGQAETQKMVDEKLQAGLDAGQAALWAGLSGASPSQIAMAALKPVRRETKSNAKRLQRKAGGA